MRFEIGDPLREALDLVHEGDDRSRRPQFTDVSGLTTTDIDRVAGRALSVGVALVLIGVDIAEQLRQLVYIKQNEIHRR